MVNQIEVNPFLYRKETIDFFQKEGVQIEAYRALRNGKEMDNETIAKIAEKHSVAVPQVGGGGSMAKEVNFDERDMPRRARWAAGKLDGSRMWPHFLCLCRSWSAGACSTTLLSLPRAPRKVWGGTERMCTLRRVLKPARLKHSDAPLQSACSKT
jgi:hypothetical protein